MDLFSFKLFLVAYIMTACNRCEFLAWPSIKSWPGRRQVLHNSSSFCQFNARHSNCNIFALKFLQQHRFLLKLFFEENIRDNLHVSKICWFLHADLKLVHAFHELKWVEGFLVWNKMNYVQLIHLWHNF